MWSLKRKRAFTLVELLVVIGIIAVLIAINLPALARARSAAERTVCLSNLQQMAQALHLYGAQYKGAIPPADPKGNAGTSYTIWRASGDTPTYIGQYTAEGWVAPGYLFYARIMRNPKAFYCPSQTIDGFTYQPRDWENPPGYRFMGYLYRIFGEAEGSGTVGTRIAQALKEVRGFKMGRMKSKALASDVHVMGWGRGLSWPHVRPWGINAAYSDGHAEFVLLNKNEYDAAYRHATKPDPGVVNASYYTVIMFKALDEKNFTELRNTFK